MPVAEETIPNDILVSTAAGIIDFDMNDRNVMIGDYDAVAHDQVPVVKVGDLGNIRAFRTPMHRGIEGKVCSRVCGNLWCNTPEQFTHAWNNYGPQDEEALLRDEVAGNYDPYHTNLWMVGQLMNLMVRSSLHTFQLNVRCQHNFNLCTCGLWARSAFEIPACKC